MNWLTLTPEEQPDVLEAVADQQNREPVILEKDFWVVWALAQTSAIDDGKVPMAFKGGTSLSKGYAAISQFSEDLDITLGLLGTSGHTTGDLACHGMPGTGPSLRWRPRQRRSFRTEYCLLFVTSAGQTRQRPVKNFHTITHMRILHVIHPPGTSPL